MRRTLITVALVLGLILSPAAFASDSPDDGASWITWLQSAYETVLDTIIFWDENPAEVTGEIAGMPEPLG